MKNDYISEIHEKDKLILHPYEDLKFRGTYNRKLIIKSDNIYLYDEDENGEYEEVCFDVDLDEKIDQINKVADSLDLTIIEDEKSLFNKKQKI